MPMLYRQSDQAPVFQYVPVPDPRYVDPRFISLGAGAYANLGLISAGGNFGVDGNQGTFHAGLELDLDKILLLMVNKV